MQHVLTRQQLYDMIWERAVSKVAPELGISDVALRKQCVKHAIPLPDATYWGRLHAGRPIKRKPLGAAPKGVSDRIVIDARAKPPAPESMEEAIAIAKQSVDAVVVPEKLHPLVAKTLTAAKKATLDLNGAIKDLGPEVFRIRAHPDTLERVGTFINTLVHHALARRHRFASGREGIEMIVDDEAIGFIVNQTIRRSNHIVTEEEKERRDRWDAKHRNDWHNWDKRPYIPPYDFKSTGEMSIEIDGWAQYAGEQRRFADTRTRKIDGRVDEILVSFAAFAAGRKIARREAEERARLEEIARQRRAEQARLAKLEEDRVKFLEGKLAQVQERDRLAAFLASLGDGSLDGQGAAYQAFLQWSRKRLDGMNARLTPEAIARDLDGIEAFSLPAVQN